MNRNLVVTAIAVLAAALLAACSSGGTVTIVDDQSTDSQTTDYAIAFVKRTIPTTTTKGVSTFTQDDLRLRRQVFASANLYLLNPTSVGGGEVNVTASVTKSGTFDIRDVDVNYDGSSILFAMRGPITANITKNDFDPPNWSIWEYVVASKYLHQICPSEDPGCSGAQYLSPHYLADGRILFATTRQFNSGAVLLNEGKPVFEAQTDNLGESAFVLHVMNSDGTSMHQITYNQSHDIDATLLQSGRIMFSRWDNVLPGNSSGIHLYTANPDGTDVQLAYGFGSHNSAPTNPGGSAGCPAGDDCTVQFVSAREMLQGGVLALVRPFTNADWGGNLVIIDTQHFTENNQANPDTPNNAGYSTTSVAEQPATQDAVLTACTNTCATTATGNLPLISPGGRFTSGFPLWDGSGRILVTWSECRLQNSSGTILPCTSTNLADTTLTAGPVLYSAWMFDPSQNTFLPITTPTESVFVTDIVSLEPRPSTPAYIPDSYSPSTTADGILDIRSVYDWDGVACNGQNGDSCNVASAGGIAGVAQTAADQRPVRFLRLVKAVSIPPAQAATGQLALKFNQQIAFGSTGNYMREIMGYVPIEPDGSVRVTVPPDVAFQVDVVNMDPNTGFVWRVFPQHNAWLSLLPGETLSCNGCHVPASQQQLAAGVSSYSHGNATLFASAWAGASAASPFPGTTSGVSACHIGQTMAEALYECAQGGNPAPSVTAAQPSVNMVFADPWFGGGAGNEPVTFSYDDPNFTTPLPTSQPCALPGGWTDTCRVIINYPTTPPSTATIAVAGNIEPLWDKPRAGGAGTCTSSGCHVPSTAGQPATAAGYLDLQDGSSNNKQEDSYLALMNPFSITTVDPTTGDTTTTQVRGQEFVSGDAAGSHFFQFFENPDAIHAGLISPAEMRLLSEWVDIGAQYFNNPFNATLQ